MDADKNVEGFIFVNAESHLGSTYVIAPGAPAGSDISPDHYEAPRQLNHSRMPKNILDPTMQNKSMTLETSMGSCSECCDLGSIKQEGNYNSHTKRRDFLVSAGSGSPKMAKTDSGDSIHNLSSQAGATQSQATVAIEQEDLDRFEELQKRLLEIDQRKRQDLISLKKDVDDFGRRLNGSWPTFEAFQSRVLAEIHSNKENLSKLQKDLEEGNYHTATAREGTAIVPKLEGEETIVLGTNPQSMSESLFANNATGSTNPAREAEVVHPNTSIPAHQQGYMQEPDTPSFSHQSNPAFGATSWSVTNNLDSTNPSNCVADFTGPRNQASLNAGLDTICPGNTELADSFSVAGKTSADLSHQNFPAVHPNDGHVYSSAKNDIAPAVPTDGHTSSGLSGHLIEGKMQHPMGVSYGDSLQASGCRPFPQNFGVEVDQAHGFGRAAGAQSSQPTRDVGVPSYQIQAGGPTRAAPSSWGDSTAAGPTQGSPAVTNPIYKENTEPLIASNAIGSTDLARETEVIYPNTSLQALQQGYRQETDPSSFSHQSSPAFGTPSWSNPQNQVLTYPGSRAVDSTSPRTHLPGNTGHGTTFSGQIGFENNFSPALNTTAHHSLQNAQAMHPNDSQIYSSAGNDISAAVFTSDTTSTGPSTQHMHGKMQHPVGLSYGDPLLSSGCRPLQQNFGVEVDQAQGLGRAAGAQSSQPTYDVGVPSHQTQTGGPTHAAPTSLEDSTSTGLNHQGQAIGTLFYPESNQSPKASTGQNTVTLLLVGSSGNGKSATGNSILSRPVFKRSASSSVQSATDSSKILMESTVIAGQHVNVIDGPGINDCGNLQPQDLDKIIEAMLTSMKLCNFKFNALLITLKFGVRFTKQEVETIKLIRCLLGKDVIRDYGVCVITHGDNFEAAVEEAKDFGDSLTFDKWIHTQTGEVKNLLEDCQNRYVLFDNSTKSDEIRQKQIKELMAVLPKGKQYTLEEFGRAGEDQAKLRLQASLPELISKLSAKALEIRSGMNLAQDHDTDIVTFVSTMAALLDEVSVLQAEVEKNPAVEMNQVSIEIKLLKNDISNKITHRLKSEELRMLEKKQRSYSNAGSSSYQDKHDDYTFAIKLPRPFPEDFLLHCENAIDYSEKIQDSNTKKVFLCIIKATLRNIGEIVRSNKDASLLNHVKELHKKVSEKLRYEDTVTTAKQAVRSEKHRPREVPLTTPHENTFDRDRFDQTPTKTPLRGASARDRSLDDPRDQTYRVNSSSQLWQQSCPAQRSDESATLLSYSYPEVNSSQVLALSYMSNETLFAILFRRAGDWWNKNVKGN